MFFFDGVNNAIEIPSNKLNHTMDSHFTISTWMKHEEDPEDVSKKGNKEHILCNADGESEYWVVFILQLKVWRKPQSYQDCS